MKVLILGSTGMLGRSLIKESNKRSFKTYGAAIDDDQLPFDITDDNALYTLIKEILPDIIINTIAIIDHNICEINPHKAYLINTRPASIIANIAQTLNIYNIHISTDHFYTGDKNKKHTENDPVSLINEYSRTKYLAECLALTYKKTLVIRTNIIGFKGNKKLPTFIEWVFNAIKKPETLTLFNDYFTSSIDVSHFSKILFDIISKNIYGTINIASSSVTSKQLFIETLAQTLGKDISAAKITTVKSLQGARRAESAGLDVSKAEDILNFQLPTLNDVIKNIIIECPKEFL